MLSREPLKSPPRLGLTMEKVKFYSLVENLVRHSRMVLQCSCWWLWASLCPVYHVGHGAKVCNIYGLLDLDYLLRSALLLFSFEFSFSCHLSFIVVTILIASCEFGQDFPVPTDLPFWSLKTPVKPSKHELRRFTKFCSKWNFQT